jgi:flagellar motor switch protein FliM
MAEQFLSQEEVDALLDGVTDDAGKPATEEPQASGPRDYRIEDQERIVRGRMPAMEIVNERFARNLRLGMFNFVHKSPEISVGPVRVIKYSAFLRDLVVPTNINVLSVTPLRGHALLIFDPKLVFAVIDSLFGGSGKFKVRIEGRDFSPTEQRIIQRMLEMTLAEYAQAWNPLAKLGFQLQRSEMHTQFANIASPSEIVVATTLSVMIGDAGGDLHVCFPYAMLEPIRDVLYSTVQGAGQDQDSRWVQKLTQQVQAAEVELAAELATTSITVGELRRLRVGDFVRIPIKPLIPVKVDGVPVMECSFGTVNGRTAVRIERMLKYSQFNERRGQGGSE